MEEDFEKQNPVVIISDSSEPAPPVYIITPSKESESSSESNTIETRKNAPNLVGHDYCVTGENLGVMNQTFFGNVGLFSIQNLASRNIVGFVLSKKARTITAEDLIALICKCIDETLDQGGVPPLILHGDCAPIYKSNTFRNFLKEAEITLSSSKYQKHGNQTIESYHHQLKVLVARNWLNTPRTFMSKEKTGFRKRLTTTQKKMSNEKKSTNKEVRNILFTEPWFEENAEKFIIEGIYDFNNNRNNSFKAYNRNQVDYYGQKIRRKSTYRGPSEAPESLSAIAEHTGFLDQVHVLVEQAKEKPPEEMVKSLDKIMVHDNYDVKELVIAGFQTSFEKTEELKVQNKQLLEKLDVITEELNLLKAEREAKIERRRKRLMALNKPERDGFLFEHYEAIMTKTAPKKNYVTRNPKPETRNPKPETRNPKITCFNNHYVYYGPSFRRSIRYNCKPGS